MKKLRLSKFNSFIQSPRAVKICYSEVPIPFLPTRILRDKLDPLGIKFIFLLCSVFKTCKVVLITEGNC